MSEEIKVIISKDGSVKLDVEGVKGSSCKDLTKGLENALGATVEDGKKNEYYEEENQNQKHQYGGGSY